MNDGARRTAGAVVGGATGVAGYWLLLRSAYPMPGVAGIGLALGVSAVARSRSLTWGLVTALLSLLLSVGTEWWFRPFVADASLQYFVAHLADLSVLSLLSLLVAAAMGFYFGRGRSPRRVAS